MSSRSWSTQPASSKSRSIFSRALASGAFLLPAGGAIGPHDRSRQRPPQCEPAIRDRDVGLAEPQEASSRPVAIHEVEAADHEVESLMLARTGYARPDGRWASRETEANGGMKTRIFTVVVFASAV